MLVALSPIFSLHAFSNVRYRFCAVSGNCYLLSFSVLLYGTVMLVIMTYLLYCIHAVPSHVCWAIASQDSSVWYPGRDFFSLSLSLSPCNGVCYLFSCMLQYLSLILDAYACTKVTQIWHVLLFISIVIVVIFGCVVSLCSFFIGSFIWWTCKIAVLGELNLLLLCLWQWKCYSVLWPVSKIGLLVISHDNVSDQPYF